MFLDDERHPTRMDWVVVRSSKDAINCVKTYGMPSEIAFDHDLGGDDTSMVFLRWLYNRIAYDGFRFPEGFKYSIHSQNPVGASNIKHLMDTLIEYCEDHE